MSVNNTILSGIRILTFVLTLILWLWIFQQLFSPMVKVMCIIGNMILVFPTVWFGRRLLNVKSTIARAGWVTTFIHDILMVLFGIAIIKAIQTGRAWRGFFIPICVILWFRNRKY